MVFTKELIRLPKIFDLAMDLTTFSGFDILYTYLQPFSCSSNNPFNLLTYRLKIAIQW